MENKKCKICRRLGVKLFLKGDRCLSPKCAMIKSPYSPGQKGKKRSRSGFSEYAKELSEKQKIKNWYNLREKQFSNYVQGVLRKRNQKEDAGTALIKKLELRLDNIVFRLGFAASRKTARQLVGHGHFTVNSRKVDVPSFQAKKGDKISVRPSSSNKAFFKNVLPALKKHQAPSWIKFNPDKLEAEITGEPSLEEASLPGEISAVFEFYSK
jgi:small subunit ribosomal protein S4